ncbi:MAG: CxxC-x17-CxxC domain-containing protein [Cyanobacteria bacterium P01_H01_bin.74]
MAKQITCAACSNVFEFSDEEQAFYESKGFNDPKKCKPCRDAAKQNRFGGGRPQRQFYDAVCAGCGIQTQVPFQPTGAKPVYCRECFQNTRSYS